MLKTIQRGKAFIVIIENAEPLEQDLINQAMKIEASFQKETYEQLNLLKSPAQKAEKKQEDVLSEKDKELLKSMPVFEKGKPSLREVITNLRGNPFVTPQQMKQILKEEYDYDYDPDTYNPDDLEER